MPSNTDHFTGKNGFARVGSTDVDIEGWSVNPEADEHDVTDTGDGGFGAYIAGIKRATFTITMKFNAAENPLDDPPGLAIGAVLSTVKLFLDGALSPYWSFPTAIVTSTPMESKVGDATTLTVNCRADGAFTDPTGNFTPAS